jgi:tripartite-type tricarboxylate transporter receptor subunit TctC
VAASQFNADVSLGWNVMIAKRIALAAALLCFSVVAASAQPYPTKPIRIIVGFAAGGPADVMARLVGQKLSTILGQSIVVENRAGAGGTLGARAVAEADADGYTLLLGNTSTLVIGPAVYRNVGYDPARSFAPVAMLGATSNFFIVHPSFAANSVQELIAMARAEPGKLNYSSPGAGTPPHLIGEMLKLKTGMSAFLRLAVEPRLGSADAFAAFVMHERDRWGGVTKAAGVKVE